MPLSTPLIAPEFVSHSILGKQYRGSGSFFFHNKANKVRFLFFCYPVEDPLTRDTFSRIALNFLFEVSLSIEIVFVLRILGQYLFSNSFVLPFFYRSTICPISLCTEWTLTFDLKFSGLALALLWIELNLAPVSSPQTQPQVQPIYVITVHYQ